MRAFLLTSRTDAMRSFNPIAARDAYLPGRSTPRLRELPSRFSTLARIAGIFGTSPAGPMPLRALVLIRLTPIAVSLSMLGHETRVKPPSYYPGR